VCIDHVKPCCLRITQSASYLARSCAVVNLEVVSCVIFVWTTWYDMRGHIGLIPNKIVWYITIYFYLFVIGYRDCRFESYSRHGCLCVCVRLFYVCVVLCR
jgi:hypothetical protein